VVQNHEDQGDQGPKHDRGGKLRWLEAAR